MLNRYLHYIFYILLLCTGCASTIDNNVQLGSVNIEPGKTTKHDINEAFGLPSGVQHKNELELWLYTDKAKLSGLMLAMPTSVSSNAVSVSTFNIQVADSDSGIAPESVVFVFNQSDTLVEVIDGRETPK